MTIVSDELEATNDKSDLIGPPDPVAPPLGVGAGGEQADHD